MDMLTIRLIKLWFHLHHLFLQLTPAWVYPDWDAKASPFEMASKVEATAACCAWRPKLLATTDRVDTAIKEVRYCYLPDMGTWENGVCS
jgi:hypothetical protein